MGLIAWCTILAAFLSISTLIDLSTREESLTIYNAENAAKFLMSNSTLEDANSVKWYFVFECFGYYLLLVPFCIFLQHWLCMMDLRNQVLYHTYSAFGLGFLLLGGTGAAFLTGVVPHLMNRYSETHEPWIEGLLVSFLYVVEGVQNLFCTLSGGIWLTGIGYSLITLHTKSDLNVQSTIQVYGMVTILLGLCQIVLFIIQLGGLQILYIDFPRTLYLLLLPMWSAWGGLSLLIGVGLGEDPKYKHE
eukprot:TRINITY_DN9627_c0_g1_i1.p1 TRINITY_DN9627_c0_g1~~TRINITY_DN9627_c0_g1_i1.p1  ORF type:complete len:264 (+),score=6.40 TRINITY_DN9627_c0_g1_i1:53-793(+)